MGEESFVELEDSQTHFMAAKACKLLGQYADSGRPFHLRLDFSDPHLPCRPSQPFPGCTTRRTSPLGTALGIPLKESLISRNR